MQHQVLILSRATDAHIERLVAELALLGQPWVLFDPGDFPEQMDLLARFGEGEQLGRLIRGRWRNGTEKWFREKRHYEQPCRRVQRFTIFTIKEESHTLYGFLHVAQEILSNEAHTPGT